MPVEIKELVVRTIINESGAQTNNEQGGMIDKNTIKKLKKEIYDELVFKIMDQLDKIKDR